MTVAIAFGDSVLAVPYPIKLRYGSQHRPWNRATFAGVTEGNPAIKKLIALAVLAFALVAGTAVVLTVHPHQAVADCSGSSGCRTAIVCLKASLGADVLCVSRLFI